MSTVAPSIIRELSNVTRDRVCVEDQGTCEITVAIRTTVEVTGSVWRLPSLPQAPGSICLTSQIWAERYLPVFLALRREMQAD